MLCVCVRACVHVSVLCIVYVYMHGCMHCVYVSVSVMGGSRILRGKVLIMVVDL